jgi:hypothetical protein
MLHAAVLLSRNGLHGYGMNMRRTWLKLPFKGNEPMLEQALKTTGEDKYSSAVRKILSDVAGTVLVKEIKLPQPLPDEMGRRAEPTPAIANPIALLIRIL